jgi:hypothetical protein
VGKSNVESSERTSGGTSRLLNYRIALKANDLAQRNYKERLKGNLDAIRTLKEVEKTGASPIPKQQKLLNQFVSWGGLSKIFENPNSAEYKALDKLLTKEEMDAAKRSTLTAFYTPNKVISKMWKMASRLGIKEGVALKQKVK